MHFSEVFQVVQLEEIQIL